MYWAQLADFNHWHRYKSAFPNIALKWSGFNHCIVVNKQPQKILTFILKSNLNHCYSFL